MSTRCNIKVTDNYGDVQWFYKHSDGYPEGMLPILNKFMDWVKRGVIRSNVGQASGWLIIIGALEYNTIPKCKFEKPSFKGATAYGDVESIKDPKDWKYSSVELTTGQHGDIEYLYEVNLDKQTIKTKHL